VNDLLQHILAPVAKKNAWFRKIVFALCFEGWNNIPVPDRIGFHSGQDKHACDLSGLFAWSSISYTRK